MELGIVNFAFDVWVTPQVGRSYVIGVDTSEGLATGDASCAQVLDARSGEQVAVYHDRVPPDELAERVCAIGALYNNALLGIESNNHGLTTITVARRIGYPNLYRRTSLNTVYNTYTQEFGWKTTRQSKALMINDLDAALRSGDVTVHDEATLTELASYQRDSRGRMGGLPHDDRVMALALANQMRQFATDPRHAPLADDFGTLRWWARLSEPVGLEPTDEDLVGTTTVRQGWGHA